MANSSIYTDIQLPGPLRQTWQLFSRDTIAMIALYAFIVLLIICLFGNQLAPYSTKQQFLGYQLLPPSWSHYGDVSFFLGTDDIGRDVLSRLLRGARPTVGSAIIITLLASIFAMIIGVVASITAGWRSVLVKHFFDTLLAIPSLLLALIVVACLGACIHHAMLAVFLATLPRLIDAIYISVQTEMEKGYVVAARLEGTSNLSIFRFSILPNIAPQLVSEFTRALSVAILDIAAFGFLNLGARPPSSEWGAMLDNSLELIYVAPWAVMLPGAAIMISVLIVNLLGDGIRRAIMAGVE